MVWYMETDNKVHWQMRDLTIQTYPMKMIENSNQNFSFENKIYID